MKHLKKILVGAMCGLTMLATFPTQVFAADGAIAFSDPETAVGDNFDVKVAVDTTSENIGDVSLTINYDSSYLKFVSADDGVTKESDGTLTYSGTGGSTEEKITLTFQALQEGSSQITLASYNVTGETSGSALSLEEGSGAVTIAEGDASKIDDSSSVTKATSGDGIEITIDGEKYTLSSEFADDDIPSGFSVANVQYEGAERTMVANESGTVYLAYLYDSSGVGDFYYYNSEDATFSKCAQIAVSSGTTITVYNAKDVAVPDNYESTTLTIDEKEFSIWQDPDDSDYYLLYAVGTDGTKGFYRYDSAQGTYQRFDPTATSSASSSDGTSSGKTSGILGKLKSIINSYFTAVIVITAVILLLLIIRLIVVRVKLRNRDIELDDLYDQYGIDLDEEEEPAPKKKKKSKKMNASEESNGPAVRKPQKTAQFDFTEDFGELDYEDEDDFDEDDFDEIDDYDDDADYYDDDEDYDDYDDYDDEEDEEDGLIDDLDELLSESPKKKRGHIEDDDTFKVDFVDL